MSTAVDTAEWVRGLPTDGSTIAFDIRGPSGRRPIVEQVRRLVDLGMVVAFYDSDAVMPPFALGRLSGAVAVADGYGRRRGAFATVEGALKHGLTMWDGYRDAR